MTRVTFVPYYYMSGVSPCLCVVWRLHRPRSGPTAAAVEARVFTEGVPGVPGEYVAELLLFRLAARPALRELFSCSWTERNIAQ